MSLGKIDYTNLDFEEIPYTIHVAGVSWEDRQDHIPNLEIDSEVYLIRDPNNQYDKNAISVKAIDNIQIGWIPKKIAEVLAPEIDAGIQWQARVEKIIGNEQQLKGVLIKLFLSKDYMI
ncbi:gp253 [Bacillus phage G]|uniref:Gp253 n=1 Tax=Bacillus phage G TaxID=2884420 RepID=G3M9Z4_9CAUD|nr:gp253 [Bacillus phage G]AEO93512.1 gp253 [Bacillus phage G]